MPATVSQYSFIQQYKSLTKQLEQEQDSSDLVCMDQEVPQIRAFLEECDIKLEAPEHATDIATYMESILGNDITNDVTSFKETSNHIFNIVSSLENSSMSVSSSNISLPSMFQPNHITKEEIVDRTVYCPNQSMSDSYNSFNCVTSPSSSSSSSSSPSSSLSSSPSSPLLSSTSVHYTNSHSNSASSSNSNIPKTVTDMTDGMKTESFVTGLSGCTVITTSAATSSIFQLSNTMTPTDFLNLDTYPSTTTVAPVINQSFLSVDVNNNNSKHSPMMCQTYNTTTDDVTPPSMSGHIDLIDMDNQESMSLYEDMKPVSEEVLKLDNFLTSPEGEAQLDEAVMWMMKDNTHSDCDQLGISYDPMAWTSAQVTSWVSWMCQKKNLPHVTAHHPISGHHLCSLQPRDFKTRFGPAGEKLAQEVDLLRTANNCFAGIPTFASSYQNNHEQQHHHHYQHQQQQQQQQQLPQCPPPYGAPTHQPPSLPPYSISPAPSSSNSSMADGSDDEINTSYNRFTITTSNPTTVPNVTKAIPRRGGKQTIHLWQFLKELLVSNVNNTDCIRWMDHSKGIFKIEDSKKVAKLWGQRKNRPAMNYDKLSRSVRQYYKKGIIKKTEQSKRLVYQFCAGFL